MFSFTSYYITTTHHFNFTLFAMFFIDILQNISSYFFCIVALLDPVDALHLKFPAFLLFALSLCLNNTININNLPIIVAMLLCNIISFIIGNAAGFKIEMPLMIHFLIFFVLQTCILWDYAIDLLRPIIVGSCLLSIATIIGFTSMIYFPELEAVLYEYSEENDIIFVMSHRTFLGVDFLSFCFKSLPIITIPACICFKDLLYSKSHKLRNLILSLLFLIAMFCAGNRAMILGLLLIVFVIAYPAFSKKRFFRPLFAIASVIALIIIWMALTEKGEWSNDVKYGHLVSYVNHFSENWQYLLFGTGAGSYFYSIGFGYDTNLSEWTYIELFRMYGIIGGALILFFLLKPLFRWNEKREYIKNWEPASLGYILFLVICGSNPYLINSTGLICIIFMYSYIANDKYCKQTIDYQ